MALALRCPAAASPSPARAPFPNSSSSSSAPRLPTTRPAGGCRCHYYHGDGAGRGHDRVPKQFREENLKDGRKTRCLFLRPH
jgi:ATP-dependent Clp protease protease subunit